MYHGIINIYKEAGYTSHDVVARLRGILGQKKIGHTGTLDPDATGVLPVCLGVGTKLCDMLTDKDKEYVAELYLGMTTDTQDMSGKVISESDKPIDKTVLEDEKITGIIQSFQGTYDQIPPMYSALKINGKKLYELARQGREVERKARSVNIEEIEILEMKQPVIKFRVVCSKGTYIRTLCDDIGKRAGCGGAMKSLVRTRVGRFAIQDALMLDEVEKLVHEGRIEDHIVSPDEMFTEYAVVKVMPEFKRLLENGNGLLTNMVYITDCLNDGENLRVYDESDHFYGIYRFESRTKQLLPVRMFIVTDRPNP